MEKIKKLLHNKLKWGFAYNRDFDGFQWTAKCKYCEERLCQDSNGDYFHMYLYKTKHETM